MSGTKFVARASFFCQIAVAEINIKRLPRDMFKQESAKGSDTHTGNVSHWLDIVLGSNMEGSDQVRITRSYCRIVYVRQPKYQSVILCVCVMPQYNTM